MKRITTLKQLHKLAMNRKAVTNTGIWKRIPAAFLINMQGTILRRVFEHGLYEYKKIKRIK